MKIIPVPCAFDNFAYLLICEQTGAAAVIDPTEAYPIWREAEAAGVELRAVFCTHHHHDHIGGLEDLLAEQPELAVYGYRGDAGRIPGLTTFMDHGNPLVIGNLQGQVMHTPGHTTGSICYHFGNALFTGDTLFGAGCGRLFEGTPDQMYCSLNEIIGDLPDETRVYFGHEYTEQNLIFAELLEAENGAIQNRLLRVRDRKANLLPSAPSTLREEKSTNPFLRCHTAGVRNKFQAVAGEAGDAEIFALVRQMRDSF